MFKYKSKDDQLVEARAENEKLLSLLDKANANIDYLSMMSDIDLDNDEEVEDETQQEV